MNPPSSYVCAQDSSSNLKPIYSPCSGTHLLLLIGILLHAFSPTLSCVFNLVFSPRSFPIAVQAPRVSPICNEESKPPLTLQSPLVISHFLFTENISNIIHHVLFPSLSIQKSTQYNMASAFTTSLKLHSDHWIQWNIAGSMDLVFWKQFTIS